MTSHSRVATPTGTPGCLQLGPQWSPQHETPNPTNHLVLTLETGEATIFTPALPSSQTKGVGILHADLSLTYLKISGVLGLGGGSADCGTFRKKEEGEDDQRK